MRKRQASQLNRRVMTGVIAMGLIVLLVCFLFLSMVSCTRDVPSFNVGGHITDAEDSVLVIEAVTLKGVEPLDSVILKHEGAFSFDIKRDMTVLGEPDSVSGCQQWAPEFYRLRIANQIVNFVVDSIETITVEASLPGLATNYDIQGNDASRTMKTIALLNIQLQRQFNELRGDGTLSDMEKALRARELHEGYKQRLKQDFIISNPSSPAAYFALMQSLDGVLLFNPESNRNDVQYFAAVATQWSEHYPAALRTQNICNIAMRGLSNTRRPRPVEIELDGDKVTETGIIDMGFPDINGVERRLSSLHDNVVLLDFTSYVLPDSRERTLQLRELYSRYHERGFEIYQVSLDGDIHRWKTMAEPLPWVCVNCSEGFANDIVSLYQVTKLPTFFIIGRGSELRSRDTQIDDLYKAIEAELAN